LFKAVPVNRRSDRAAYHQIADQLRQAILEGQFSPAEQNHLPSQADLAKEFKVSRVTVDRALTVLRTEGLILTEQGRRAIVRGERPLKRLARGRLSHGDPRGFFADMRDRTPRSSTEIYHKPVPRDIARELQLKAGEEVLVRYRTSGEKDGPMLQIATSYIPTWLEERIPRLAKRNTGRGGIYARMEQAGFRLHWQEAVSARMPRQDEAHTLQLPPGEPIIRVVRTTLDVDGNPLEVMDTILAASGYELIYNFPD